MAAQPAQASPELPALPTGTVTFLFTDVEGSTKLLNAHPDAYRAAVRRHHALLLEAVEAHQGVVFETLGEGVCAAFARPTDAVRAALQGQVLLAAQEWGETPLRVRMGIHVGEVEVYADGRALRDARYFGIALVRVGRLMGAAHGGQVVLSAPVAELVGDALPDGAALGDLGQHRLKDLQHPERVFQLVHPELPADFPPLRSLDALPHNLPLQVTSFVGRERELTEVGALLPQARLLTLTGTGGCGKTRLALQVAADQLERYPDGVWFVDLSPLADPALVPQAALAALGVPEAPVRPATAALTEHLRDRTALVVLDNCEHLLDACAHLADALLRACPRVTVLATSRELLGIAGEAAYRVPSLTLPTLPLLPDPAGAAHAPPVEGLARSEAVRLFAERAALVVPGFRVTDANAAAVAEVCRRLDGMPLALELAAARVRVLAPDQLAARLADRFRLLTGGSRTALRRQQTLRAAIDWSHELLPAADRVAFRRLAVFAGGWTLEAAEAVCPDGPDGPDRPHGPDGPAGGHGASVGAAGGGTAGVGSAPPDGSGIPPEDVLDRLTELVDKSLVVAEAPAGRGEARYRLLETLRQYAEEQLLAAGGAGGAEAVRRRHAVYYLGLAERTAPALDAGGDAYVAALDRLEADLDNLRAALRWWLDTGDAGDAERGLRLAVALRTFWRTRGYLTEGRAVLTEALAVADQAAHETNTTDTADGALAALRAQALGALAGMAAWQGDFDAQRRLGEQALAIWRRLGDKPGVAAALGDLEFAASRQGNYVAAEAFLRDRRVLLEELGDRHGLSHVLGALGVLARYRGDYAAARRLTLEMFAIRRELGGPPASLAFFPNNLGLVAYEEGALAEARRLHEESLAQRRQIGDKWGLSESLENLGRVAHAAGDLEAARRLLAESLALDREIGDRQGAGCALTYLGHVALDQADLAAARTWLREALAVLRDVGDRRIIADALDGLAGLAAAEDAPRRALRLAGASAALREEIGRPTPPVQRPAVARWLAPAQAALDGAIQEAALGEGRTMTLEQAIAYALDAHPAPEPTNGRTG